MADLSGRRAVWRAGCVAVVACFALQAAPLSAQAWQRQQQLQQQQQQQRQIEMQRQQAQEQQRRIMQEQQRESMRQQANAQQRALQQQRARTGIGNDHRSPGATGSGANARLTRQPTPAEIQRGFTGRVTPDGRALIKFQNRMLVVPASRVSGLSAKLAARQRAQGSWSKQQWAGANASIKALVANSAAARSRKGGGAGSGGGGRVAANDNDMAANRIAYSNFVKQSGRDPMSLFPHRRGWDFTKPTRVTTIKAGTELCQWMVPGQAGAYYGECGTPPTRLGISDHGENSAKEKVPRILKRFVATRDLQSLTGIAAAGFDDWSVKGERTPTLGGRASTWYARRIWTTCGRLTS